jgi:hypothetical protein
VSPSPSPEVLPPFAPAPVHLLRLTRGQYLATVVDLLGPGLTLPTDLEVDTPLHGFSTVGAGTLTIGPRAVEQYEGAALSLASQVFADTTRREALVGCAPSGPEDPCVDAFLARFGRRVFRRSLEPDERAAWRAAFEAAWAVFRDPWPALETAVGGLLQSPNFLYRVEVGVPDDGAAGARRRLTSVELAARVSYFLWGTTPDDALLDAAERGELDTLAGLEREARRLLASPRARAGLRQFFVEHLRLTRLDGLTKNAAAFPQLTPTLGASMRREVEALVDALALAPGADVRALLDTREAFVNGELARLYGLPDPGAAGDALVAATHPPRSPRAGLLTTAGFLALNAHASVSSPTLRGKFIQQYLMCQEIEPPPPGVTTELAEPDPSAAPQSLRQRLEALHLNTPACAGCHLRMDPLGFALESFDAIGAYRTTDNGVPVDTRGYLDGEPFDDARGLAALIKGDPRFPACLARMTYRYAVGHRETAGEAVVLRALAERFRDVGHQYPELAIAVITSDGFRFAARED